MHDDSHGNFPALKKIHIYSVLDRVPSPLLIFEESGAIVFSNSVFLRTFSSVQNIEVFTKGISTSEIIQNIETSGNFEMKRLSAQGLSHLRIADIAFDFIDLEQQRHIIATFKDVTDCIPDTETLKQSEQRFEAAVKAVEGVIWTNDPNGEMRGNQPGWEELTGQTFEEYQGFGWSNVIHPEDVQTTIDDWKKAVDEKSHFDTEHRVRLRNGNWEIFTARAVPTFNEDGTIREWVGVHTNITKHREAEIAIQESQERYQNFISQSSEGIWRCELDAPIDTGIPAEDFINLIFERAYMAECNDAMAQMYGFDSPADLINIRITELFPRNEESEAFFTHFIESGYRVQDLESHEMTRLGDMKYFLNNFIGILQNGYIHRAWGTQRDITFQKKAENALAESEANFRQLADLIPQIIWTSTADGKLDYFNKRWFDYVGPNAPYGSDNWTQILHPQDMQTCALLWSHSLATGQPFQMEFRIKNFNAEEYRWFLGKALPIRDKDEVITKWFGTCTDINDQKLMNVHLEEMVAVRTEELQRSNEDLQQFAHVASHDMKEPIRKIMTFASRLTSDYQEILPERAQNFLDKISNAASRSFSMIDGVLLYSSMNTTHRATERINLNELIHQIEGDWERVIQQKEARIKVAELPALEGSIVLLHQLFYNLIGNSLKFSKPDVPPVIEIGDVPFHQLENPGFQPDENEMYVSIFVRDNGIGFSDEEVDRIFGAFTRLHSKDKYEGTGLGLALCKKIAERHGGGIHARGTDGEGAEFIVTLPVKAVPQ